MRKKNRSRTHQIAHDELKRMHEDVAKKIVSTLASEGIECYIWHVATTGSVYIRFADPRMCSIRIGDHDGKEKLRYKYNIRSDSGFKSGWVKDENIWRHYLPINRWAEITQLMKDRREQIAGWKENSPKYEYGVPKFKKDIEFTENELKNG